MSPSKRTNGLRGPGDSSGQGSGGRPRDDPFADEHVAETLLHELVDQQGLKDGWQNFASRLRALEASARAHDQRFAKLPEDFASRKEILELEAEHSSKLLDQAEQLGRLEAHCTSLKRTIVEDHTVMLNDCKQRLWAAEDRDTKLEKRLDDLAKRMDKEMRRLQYESEAADERHDRSLAVVTEGLRLLEQRVQEDLERAAVEAKELVERVDKALRDGPQLLENNEEEGGIQNNRLLEFVELHLLAPVRQEIAETRSGLVDVRDQHAQQVKDHAKDLLGLENHVTSTCARLDKKFGDWTIEIGNCPSRHEHEAMKQMFIQDTASLSHDVQTLNATAMSKMNDLIDHFAKMHDMLKAHEEALHVHSEELESRSTKYDILICQTQIDKCAVREEVDRDVKELQRTIAWQVNKIESFGLHAAMVSSKSGKLRATSRRAGTSAISSHAASRVGTLANLQDSVSSATELTDSGEGDGDGSRRGSENTVDAHGALFGALDFSGIGEGDDDASSEGDSPNSFGLAELHTQLETITMGLVGLAHMSLREPTLGVSRKARVQLEKDLLEQLRNLRHWITHKRLPSGWSPDQITTLSLRCDHPQPQETWTARISPHAGGDGSRHAPDEPAEQDRSMSRDVGDGLRDTPAERSMVSEQSVRSSGAKTSLGISARRPPGDARSGAASARAFHGSANRPTSVQSPLPPLRGHSALG